MPKKALPVLALLNTEAREQAVAVRAMFEDGTSQEMVVAVGAGRARLVDVGAWLAKARPQFGLEVRWPARGAAAAWLTNQYGTAGLTPPPVTGCSAP